MSVLREYLALPPKVQQGDFVIKLAEGVAHPDQVLGNYALTEGIVSCLDSALALVGSGLTSKRSYGAYVHGSFGSGKSHFMAVLSLLLADNARAWDEPELHALRAKHAWTAGAKVLRLHLHMIGAQSIEQRVFGEYLARAGRW